MRKENRVQRFSVSLAEPWVNRTEEAERKLQEASMQPADEGYPS